MNFSIDGSFTPYVYILLLQISVFFLQHPGMMKLISTPAGPTVTDWYDSYCLATRALGASLNWCGWMLAFYVGYRFGTPSGVLFFCISFASSFALVFIKPSSTKSTVAAHVTSIPVTIYLVYATLHSVGLEWVE